MTVSNTLALLSITIPASLFFSTSLFAQETKHSDAHPLDRAFVTRHGASVRGALDAGLTVVGEDSDVVVERGASITGDVVLPLEKGETAKLGAVQKLRGSEGAPAAAARLQNRSSADALRGELLAATAFDLPEILAPVRPISPNNAPAYTSTQDLGESSEPDKSPSKGKTKREILPGAYGDTVLAEGTIVLGTVGAVEPVRYEFQSLQVDSGATMDVVSPVMVLLARGATLKGVVGNPEAPLWLDLRVAAGDVAVGAAAKVYGMLTAPTGTVKLDGGAVLTGSVVSDRLVIEPGAKATAVAAEWSAAATAKTKPRFPHKALRLQSKLPDLKSAFRHSYYPAVSYVDDVPFVMLAEGKRPREHPRAQFESQRALFEACCSLFVDTGFERGGVVLADYTDDPIASAAPTRNVILTRGQFERLLAAVGKKPDTAANVEAITWNARLLEQFAEQVIESSDSASG